jgi:hypothetical protein
VGDVLAREVAELNREKAELLAENTRLQRALHLLLANSPMETDASLCEQ